MIYGGRKSNLHGMFYLGEYVMSAILPTFYKIKMKTIFLVRLFYINLQYEIKKERVKIIGIVMVFLLLIISCLFLFNILSNHIKRRIKEELFVHLQ